MLPCSQHHGAFYYNRQLDLDLTFVVEGVIGSHIDIPNGGRFGPDQQGEFERLESQLGGQLECEGAVEIKRRGG